MPRDAPDAVRGPGRRFPFRPVPARPGFRSREPQAAPELEQPATGAGKRTSAWTTPVLPGARNAAAIVRRTRETATDTRAVAPAHRMTAAGPLPSAPVRRRPHLSVQ